MPSEIVTKEDENPDAVHVLDPEHVRDTILDDWANQKLGKKLQKLQSEDIDKMKAEGLPPVGVVWPFSRRSQDENQRYVDIIKKRAAFHLLAGIKKRMMAGQLMEHEVTVWHLYWPKDNVNDYILRAGNPPADVERPSYLKRLNLVIDLNEHVGAIEIPPDEPAEESRIITDF